MTELSGHAKPLIRLVDVAVEWRKLFAVFFCDCSCGGFPKLGVPFWGSQ